LRRSLDTEVTGVDLHHGAKPYFVTTCDSLGNQSFWEWDVNPETRQPIIPDGDLYEIEQEINEADELILQNPKFDAGALATLENINGWKWEEFPWDKVLDTLLAGHLLASNKPHNLTDMAMYYLGVDIQPFEDAVRKATKDAREYCKRNLPSWRVAREGLPEMPSARDSKNKKKDSKGEQSDTAWKFDMWLPRALATHLEYAEDHPWYTVLRDYGNADSAVTVALIEPMLDQIHKRGLSLIYRERLKLLPIIQRMEYRGVTINRDRKIELKDQYVTESNTANNSEGTQLRTQSPKIR
jgi:DNA polymerase I-like protein with 3'-5' exonuclease and polymerase domains